MFLRRVARFDGLNDSHITPGTMIFCSMISMNNFSDCVIASCEQGSTSKNLCPCCKPQNMVIFKGVIYTERPSGSTVIKEPLAEHNKMNMIMRKAHFCFFKPCLLMSHNLRDWISASATEPTHRHLLFVYLKNPKPLSIAYANAT